MKLKLLELVEAVTTGRRGPVPKPLASVTFDVAPSSLAPLRVAERMRVGVRLGCEMTVENDPEARAHAIRHMQRMIADEVYGEVYGEVRAALHALLKDGARYDSPVVVRLERLLTLLRGDEW